MDKYLFSLSESELIGTISENKKLIFSFNSVWDVPINAVGCPAYVDDELIINMELYYEKDLLQTMIWNYNTKKFSDITILGYPPKRDFKSIFDLGVILNPQQLSEIMLSFYFNKDSTDANMVMDLEIPKYMGGYVGIQLKFIDGKYILIGYNRGIVYCEISETEFKNYLQKYYSKEDIEMDMHYVGMYLYENMLDDMQNEQLLSTLYMKYEYLSLSDVDIYEYGNLTGLMQKMAFINQYLYNNTQILKDICDSPDKYDFYFALNQFGDEYYPNSIFAIVKIITGKYILYTIPVNCEEYEYYDNYGGTIPPMVCPPFIEQIALLEEGFEKISGIKYSKLKKMNLISALYYSSSEWTIKNNGENHVVNIITLLELMSSSNLSNVEVYGDDISLQLIKESDDVLIKVI